MMDVEAHSRRSLEHVPRITIELEPSAFDRLLVRADRERRSPQSEAAVLVERAVRRVPQPTVLTGASEGRTSLSLQERCNA